MKVTDSKDLLCKIIQNIRFRAPIFNQSLQESEHKKACILSHNVFSHQSVSSSKRASTGASGGGKIFSQAFACIFGPKELLIIKEPGNTTTGTHNSKISKWTENYWFCSSYLRHFKQANTVLIFFLVYKRSIPSSSQFEVKHRIKFLIHSGRAKPWQVIFRDCFGSSNVPKRLLPKLLTSSKISK